MNEELSEEQRSGERRAWRARLLVPARETRRSAVAAEKRERQRFMVELAARVEELRALRRSGNVLSYAQALLAVESKVWNTNPWLLDTRQGTIDLRTGALRTGRPDGSVRTIIPTAWKGLDAPAPRFEQFLRELFADREENERGELIAFLQRALGYGITGHTRERIFLLFYGEEGHNGRGTFMHILQYVLGRALGSVSQDVLSAGGRFSTPDSVKPHLGNLQGRRIVWADEPDGGTHFAADRIKLLTGEEAIVARQLYGKEFSFAPSHLLILLSSRRPQADESDHAFWERVCPIAFNVRFMAQPERPNERLRDVGLARELEAEASGILAWLVRGALDWQRLGLAIPRDVLQRREEYRAGESAVAHFVRACCTLDPNAQIPAGLLYKRYRAWAGENDVTPVGGKQFAREMRQIEGVKWQRNKQSKLYQGITLQDVRES